MLRNIQRYINSMEDFDNEETPAPVETVDTTNVEASVEPEADVVEAADNVAQETPTEEIAPDGDLEVVEESSSVPEPMNDSIETPTDTPVEPEVVNNEVSELLNQADAIQTTQDEIIAGATADADAIANGTTDVNGNSVPEGTDTEEEAVLANTDDTSGVLENTDVEQVSTDNTVDDGGEASESTIIEEEIPETEEVVEETSEADLAGTPDSDAAALDSTPEETTDGEVAGDDTVIEELPGGDATPEETNDEIDVVTPELQGEIASSDDDSTPSETGDEAPIEETSEEVQEDVIETETTDDVISEDAGSADIEQVESEEPVVEEEVVTDEPVVDETETVVEEPVVDEVETTDEEPILEETSEETPEEIPAEAEETQEEVVDEVPEETVEDKDLEEQVEEEDGEIDEEGDANFEDGELDIEDVDTDVTEEEVAEAKVEADEAEEEADADDEEIVDASKTIEELQAEKESVESFIGILKYGLEKGDFQPQFMIMSQSKLDQLSKAFGEHAPSIPSMESFGKDDLDQYYTSSLESFRGFLNRISNLNRSLLEAVDKWRHSGIVKKVKSRSKALNKDVDLALVKLQDAKIGTVSVKGVNASLATTDTNLAQAVAKDLRVLSEIAVKGLRDSERVQQEVVNVIDKAVTDGGKGKTGPLVQTALNIKPAKYPVVKNGDLLGGWVLETEVGGRGKDSDIEKLAYTTVPVAKKTKVEGRGVTYDLSKGDCANLLKLAKAYVALADKLADSAGSKAVESFLANTTVRDRALNINGISRATRASTWDEQSQLDDLATVLLKVAEAHVSIYKFTTQHALDVAEGIVAAVRKAL